MANPVVHWEIMARDGKRLGEFYAHLFGWKSQAHEPTHYTMMESGGPGGIAGGIMNAPPGQPTYVTFYVQVEDLQAYLDKAQELGAKTVLPPMPIPDVGSIAMFQDPEGNMIGLFKK